MKDKKHRLVGAVVTCVERNEEYKDMIYDIWFKKGNTKYKLSIDGYDAETKLKVVGK